MIKIVIDGEEREAEFTDGTAMAPGKLYLPSPFARSHLVRDERIVDEKGRDITALVRRVIASLDETT